MKPYTGPPATLGNTVAAQARLIVWCRHCQHRVEPDPAEHAARYGAELPVSKQLGQAAEMLAVRQPQRRFRAHRGTAVAAPRHRASSGGFTVRHRPAPQLTAA